MGFIRMVMTTEKRFFLKVKKTKSCWNWTAYKTEKGYGKFGFRGTMARAHRVSWILNYGEIPRALFVLHSCDNRSCVNPKHLFLGTQADNIRDMDAKGRRSRGEKHSKYVLEKVLKGIDHPRSKLSWEDCEEIKHRHAQGVKSVRAISRDMGISHTLANKAIHGIHWSQL